MKKFLTKSSVKAFMLIFSIITSSCGGGGGNGGGSDNDTTTPGLAPTLVWSFDTDAKNPTTYLAACAELIMTCEDGGSTMRDCIGSAVDICQDTTPTDGCCPQACSDQLIQELDKGENDQDAFLTVFVYDRSCMPGLTRDGAQP